MIQTEFLHRLFSHLKSYTAPRLGTVEMPDVYFPTAKVHAGAQ